MKSTKDHSHPGSNLREVILPSLGLSVTEAAKQLGVSRPTLSKVINENAAVSSEMAIRLEQWLLEVDGNNADNWVIQQAIHDLHLARLKFKDSIKPAKRCLKTSNVN